MKAKDLSIIAVSVIAVALVLTVASFAFRPLWRPTVPGGEMNANANQNRNAPQELSAHLKLDLPRSGQTVTSPLEVAGQAAGWYFEGSFPVELKDATGAVIATAPAQAQGDWMTADFVPFRAALIFKAPETATGTLVLKKDNPSGLPANDESVSIPVKFAPASLGDCRRGGCSGQICSDQDMVSTCEYAPAYACYRSASCERQSDGKCGWTMTPELERCLTENGTK